MNSEYHPFLRVGRWLRRIRHRRGYGVHSPFSFDLISSVIYNKDEYYSYDGLRKKLDSHGKDEDSGLIEKDLKLLFRLANFQEAKTITLSGDSSIIRAYLRAACPKAEILGNSSSSEYSDLYYFDSAGNLPSIFHLSASALIIVRGIHRDEASEARWAHLKASEEITLTFDLWRFGLALRRPKLQKQDYKINYF